MPAQPAPLQPAAPSQPPPALAAARMARWARLSASLKLGLSLILGLMMALSSAASGWLIDTTAPWNGSWHFGGFGVGSLYGQTIRAPASAALLQEFSFQLNPQGQHFSLQAHVYAWDNSQARATGPALYSSPEVHSPASHAFESFTFAVPDLALAPGGHYVLFAQLTGGAAASDVAWAAVEGNPYPEGVFVFLQHAANPADWTQQTWSGAYSSMGQDLAFSARLSTASGSRFAAARPAAGPHPR